MARPQLPVELLSPSSFGKNRKRTLEVRLRDTTHKFPVLDISQPPPVLAHDEIASRYWGEVSSLLQAHKVLTFGDVNSLVNYCRVLADIERDEHIVMLDGRTFMDEKGTLRKHPLISVISENRRMSNVLAQQFGLTPASRARAIPATAEPEKVVNPFAED